MRSQQITIAIVDNHYLFAEALADLLAAALSFKEIKLYRNTKQFFESEKNELPEIILTEIIHTDTNGIDFLVELKKQYQHSNVIFLSSVTEVRTMRLAMRKGASGYLSKNSSSKELINAILAVDLGDIYIGENLQYQMIRGSLADDTFVFNLSPREKEVLQFVCSGKTIKETANEMRLSVNTVQTYYKTILKKFKLNRTADLIVFAMQNGLYNPKTNSMMQMK